MLVKRMLNGTFNAGEKMKSTEVYKIINLIIKDDFKALGYKKTKGGMLGFYKQINKLYVIFWFQCSQSAFNFYTGSKFTIEFQLSETDGIGSEAIERHRISHYLTQEELQYITKKENEIRKNMKKPPSNYSLLNMSDDIKKWFMKNYEPIRDVYNNDTDIWLRYIEEKDIKEWVEYFKNIIKRIVGVLEQKAMNQERPLIVIG